MLLFLTICSILANIEIKELNGALVPIESFKNTYVVFVATPSCSECNYALADYLKYHKKIDTNDMETIIILKLDSNQNDLMSKRKLINWSKTIYSYDKIYFLQDSASFTKFPCLLIKHNDIEKYYSYSDLFIREHNTKETIESLIREKK